MGHKNPPWDIKIHHGTQKSTMGHKNPPSGWQKSITSVSKNAFGVDQNSFFQEWPFLAKQTNTLAKLFTVSTKEKLSRGPLFHNLWVNFAHMYRNYQE